MYGGLGMELDVALPYKVSGKQIIVADGSAVLRIEDSNTLVGSSMGIKGILFVKEDSLTEGVEGDFEYFEIILNGKRVVAVNYQGTDRNVRIPAKINKLPVTAIYGGFYDLTSVSIPNSVTTIMEDALSGNQLTSVTIPNSVTTIMEDAFGDNQLTSVSIPNSVTYLGGFSGNQLTSISIPNSVTSIGDSAFSDNQLTSVTIPNSVTSIGWYAFSGNQLTSVSIPNSVTSIEWGAFANNQLTSVTIPNSVTIHNEAFEGNPLTSITIGRNVTIVDTNERNAYWPAFPNRFNEYYIANGKKAGTYTYQNGQWSAVYK